MVVKPIEFGMIQQQNNISQMQHNADSAPVAQQQNISQVVQHNAEVKSEQVNQKDDTNNSAGTFDARDKSDNEYYTDKDGKQKKRRNSDGRVFIKGQGSIDFDIKI